MVADADLGREVSAHGRASASTPLPAGILAATSKSAHRTERRDEHFQDRAASRRRNSAAWRRCRRAPDLGADATRDITAELNALLADTFALYLKTKNFHWHLSGPSFRDYHLLLDEQADQIYATADPIAERVRKVGGTTLRSIGHIARLQRLADNDADFVTPWTCWPSCVKTICGSRPSCARRTGCAINTGISPPRACSSLDR
jgi:DNA-binding ferritin-like protein